MQEIVLSLNPARGINDWIARYCPAAVEDLWGSDP
jgi:hypothetical protein